MTDQGLRLDTFPYRFRVADAMSAPLVTASAETRLDAVLAIMDRARVSSVVVLDRSGNPAGIVTERDAIERIARAGPAALAATAGSIMSAPVHTVAASALLYVAIGRMDRLRVRHLVAVDAGGQACGMLTARGLLRQRAGGALRLGDAAAVAPDAAALAAVWAEAPALAAELLHERVPAAEVAGVIGAIIRDMSARAALLAAAALLPAPGGLRWSFLVLGSAGRGESLLAPDQDNALAYDPGGPEADAWAAALGERAAAILDAARIPFCRGGVMASRPAWRRSLPDWLETVAGWTRRLRPESLLNVDIFHDFEPVAGDRALAETLRREAAALSRGAALPRALASGLADFRPPLTFFGGLPDDGRRLDLKHAGLYPIVAGARAIALKHGWTERGTIARLERAAAAGVLGEEDLAALIGAFQLHLRLLLEQQLLDIAAGAPPGPTLDLRRLTRPARRALREALGLGGLMAETVRTALSEG